MNSNFLQLSLAARAAGPGSNLPGCLKDRPLMVNKWALEQGVCECVCVSPQRSMCQSQFSIIHSSTQSSFHVDTSSRARARLR